MKKIGMKKAYVVIAIMIALAPLFAWLAEEVGYSEPLENAAEETGAGEGSSIFSGIFPDYTVPGVNPYLSALITGLIGCLILISVAMIWSKLKNG